MILSQCPKVVCVRLQGTYDEARGAELTAQLREAHNAEIVFVDVRAVTAVDPSCLARLVRMRRLMQGICSVRIVGANSAVRTAVRDAGADRALAVLGAIDCVLAEAYIDSYASA